MERLTKKCDVITRTTASVGETEYVVKENKFGKAINKLGELEDVLEEFELTSAEDLRNYLNFKGNMAIWEGELNYKNKIADLEQENQQLKQSQKQLAISELRRIKEYILINDEYDEEAGCNIIETFDLIEDIIDRIEKLGGGENE